MVNMYLGSMQGADLCSLGRRKVRRKCSTIRAQVCTNSIARAPLLLLVRSYTCSARLRGSWPRVFWPSRYCQRGSWSTVRRSRAQRTCRGSRRPAASAACGCAQSTGALAWPRSCLTPFGTHWVALSRENDTHADARLICSCQGHLCPTARTLCLGGRSRRTSWRSYNRRSMVVSLPQPTSAAPESSCTKSDIVISLSLYRMKL